MMGPPPKPSASGFGGERRCDGVSETCPVSQGQGEGYTVRTDESEGLAFSNFLGRTQRPSRDAPLGPILTGQNGRKAT